MKQWEYKRTSQKFKEKDLSTQDKDISNELGLEGWELVSTDIVFLMGFEYILLSHFKRPKKITELKKEFEAL